MSQAQETQQPSDPPKIAAEEVETEVRLTPNVRNPAHVLKSGFRLNLPGKHRFPR